MLHKQIRVLLTYVVPLACTLFATTIHVPSQYLTIQAGLNAAQTNDTVLVAAGTYEENIMWPSLDGIVLLSEQGPSETIIDGGYAGRVFDFPNFVFTRNTKISGFAIQHGNAAAGAGLRVYGSLHVFGNIIQRNTANVTSGHAQGGGISCCGTGTPLIENNLIHGNIVCGPSWNTGAGVYVDVQNAAIIRGNRIECDSAIGGSWNRGAGIYCATGSTPEICHNIMQGNITYQGSEGSGGGIYVWMNARAYVLSNLICQNRVQSDTWNYGAGIYINRGNVVINNTIVDNRCMGGLFRRGGGIYVHDSSNFIGNNIIVDNKATFGGGISAGSNGSALLLHNDVWSNVGGDYYGIVSGSNDISLDPLFASGPLGYYYLSHVAAGQVANSPCIDYGFASAESLGLDTYTTRTDTIHDSAIVDLGYHYPTSYPGKIEEFNSSYITSSYLRISPNPFRRATTIEFALTNSNGVDLRIYDVSGRIIKTLDHLSQERFFQIAWDGKDDYSSNVPSGIYFLQLRGGDINVTEKLLLIR